MTIAITPSRWSPTRIVVGATNDPYGEHDFGVVELAGRRVFWKIDYYDVESLYGSEDPANPDVTTMVLTIFFADEY